ncbi:MAG TPA: histidine-type phosphatase [Mucilaginibacter sp.]|nr:histidine-type phosphatase [Mucilaginibacter sp.]
MKKTLLFLFLFCGIAASALAQNCDSDFLGTKTLYPAPAQLYTPVPAGYAPVFINYVGRHGARHLTKDVKISFAYRALQKADSLNALTQKGEKLWQMVKALQKVEQSNVKNISDEGRDELMGIAQRMYNNNRLVFKERVKLNVSVTREIRTTQSADAFLKGLNNALKKILAINKFKDDTHLRFYDFSPAYDDFEKAVDNGSLMQSLRENENVNSLNDEVAARFLSSEFLKKLDEGKKDKFVSDIFGFVSIVPSLDQEIKQAGYSVAALDFKSFFSCDQLARLGFLDAVDDNLKKGPAMNNNGIQVRISAPLLVNFINTSDKFVKSHPVNAELRFAHAETIAPFAALLRLSGADGVATTPKQLKSSWSASKVAPLSSNIQWIFYRNRRGNILVKILLNENEVRISGLTTSSFPYYKWADVRTFYMEELKKLDIKLTDDMKAYLTDLK